MTTVAPATRRANTERALRAVAGGYSKMTPAFIARREGWTVRTVNGYLRDLEDAGLAEPICRAPGRETAWRVTDAGKAHLLDVTTAPYGTRFDLHPATLGRDQHNGN